MDTSALKAFKYAFRRHAAGVAVITTIDSDGKPHGFTATSLASLAAEPPLVTFNMAQISTSWPSMSVGSYVAVHMMGARSRPLAEKMAGDHDLRFTGDHWHVGPHGLPILDGVPAWMLAKIVEIHLVHANAVIVAQVESGELGDEDDALLYNQRRYFVPGEIA
jgi:flavin reductase (DIM6/NTAB) family NADH-FMN oxidoreductase RutF